LHDLRRKAKRVITIGAISGIGAIGAAQGARGAYQDMTGFNPDQYAQELSNWENDQKKEKVSDKSLWEKMQDKWSKINSITDVVTLSDTYRKLHLEYQRLLDTGDYAVHRLTFIFTFILLYKLLSRIYELSKKTRKNIDPDVVENFTKLETAINELQGQLLKAQSDQNELKRLTGRVQELEGLLGKASEIAK